MDARGFTLVEILISMAILSLIIAIVGGRFNETKRTAYVAAMQADLRHLASAQEGYYDEAGGTYGATLNQLNFEPTPDVKLKIKVETNGWSARAEHKYLKADKYYCAIFMGDVNNPFLPAEEEGILECEPKKTKRKKKKK